jgi:DNA polymerase elongation subunit (family B)
MTVAYKSLTNLSDCFGSVQMWDSILYNEMRRRNLVVPPKKKVEKERQIEGAFVKDPIIGMHDWVMSFDLNSLYPHIIMQYNMSPETIVDKKINGVTVDRLIEGDEFKVDDTLSMCATGQYFVKNTKGIIPELIQSFYDERVQAKKEMLQAKQEIQRSGKSKALERKIATLGNKELAIKILMNSLYGALSIL